ncbi:hypothetical protein IFM89_034567 [Coptis chinensis]|uniref:Uncharacterized protein n=1 Tax=Coptis chinensis TaxID=261450 RepID=A0A835LTY1_9MAGN|nr:hypothetical protein IFM89_034567 [Coptis chinensis]
MVHVNIYRSYGKTFKKPLRPYQKEHLDAELKLVEENLLTLDEKNPLVFSRVKLFLEDEQLCPLGCGRPGSLKCGNQKTASGDGDEEDED